MKPYKIYRIPHEEYGVLWVMFFEGDKYCVYGRSNVGVEVILADVDTLQNDIHPLNVFGPIPADAIKSCLAGKEEHRLVWFRDISFSQPKNNDGRDTCYSCGGPTRPCGGAMYGVDYRVCVVCGK